MSSSPVSGLPAISAVTNTDILLFVDVNEPVSTNRSKRGTVDQLIGGLPNVTDSVAGLMSAADKTSFDAATDAATNSALVRRDSSGAASFSQVSATRMFSSASPSGSTELANKAYVDASAQGLNVHAPCAAATTATVTLTGGAPLVVDGVTLTTGSRILVKDQTTASQNGIYIPTSIGTGSNGTWVRTTDANANGELVTGTYTFVTGGTVNLNGAFVISSANPILIGTSPIVWTQYSSISSISASAIVGLIASTQIGSLNAGTIIGSITASQIGSVNANIILGSITATQIGSVNAGAIVGSITATQISTVNAGAIVGSITSGQIASVNASVIAGTITATQISTVNAGSITGSITAGQISSLNATSITGVIVTNQLQTGILDTLSLIANNLMVVQQVSSLPTLPDANFPANSTVLLTTTKVLYKNVAGTWTAQTASSTLTGSLTAADITSVNTSALTGLIIAAQISTVNASSITGSITSSQIGSVNASAIAGSITSGQISSVSASAITGSITSGQIGSVSAGAIVGGITSSQISSVNAGTVTGTFAYNQIGSVDATTITVNTISDSQIGSVSAGKLTAGTISAQTITLDSSGSIRSSNYSSGSAGFAVNGDGSAEFSNVIVRGSLQSSDISFDCVVKGNGPGSSAVLEWEHNGGDNWITDINDSDNRWRVYNIDSSGSFGMDIGTGATASVSLKVWGSIVATGSITPSSKHLKDDVRPLESVSDRLMQLTPVRFVWNDQAPKMVQTVHDFGLIAEDTQKIFPELANYGGTDCLGLEYPKLTVLLLKAYQELKVKFDALNK